MGVRLWITTSTMDDNMEGTAAIAGARDRASRAPDTGKFVLTFSFLFYYTNLFAT